LSLRLELGVEVRVRIRVRREGHFHTLHIRSFANKRFLKNVVENTPVNTPLYTFAKGH